MEERERERERVCHTESGHQSKPDKTSKEFLDTAEMWKGFTTFQASPFEPPPTALSSDQTTKALLRHAELDMAPARPSTGSWHLYSQHGNTKQRWNSISSSLGRRYSREGNVWPVLADLEMTRTSTRSSQSGQAMSLHAVVERLDRHADHPEPGLSQWSSLSYVYVHWVCYSWITFT